MSTRREAINPSRRSISERARVLNQRKSPLTKNQDFQEADRESVVIFICDPDAPLVREIKKVLHNAGFVTAAAHTGHQAIAWLSRNRPGLMLLDLALPDVSGRELIKRLMEAKSLVPFVITTAQGDERVAVEMMKKGALDYLVKDGDFLQSVTHVVRRALAQLHRERQLGLAQEALRRSEGNLAKAQQIAHLGSYEICVPFSKEDYRSDEIFRIIGLQPRAKKMSTEDYIRRYVHHADRERFRQIIERSIHEASPFDFEYRIIRPDGTIRYVQSVGEPVINERGQVHKIVGTLLDLTERKQLETALLDISEREQRRIGQDLHDGLGQHLAGIELLSRVLEQNLAMKKLKTEAARAAELAKHVRDAITQTRSLARGLAPVVLESEGLMSALQELADNTNKIFGVSCRFRYERLVPVHDPSTATHLYRIAQEAVSNGIKHGKAKQIIIHLQWLRDVIRLSIRDDGSGMPKEIPKHKGMGLRIMQYRASMVGASLTVRAEPGGGTVVICSLRGIKGL